MIIIVACSPKGKSDYYNLNFQKKFIDGWISEIDMGRLYYDSTAIIDGNMPVCIDNENIKAGKEIIRRWALYYSLGRKISLPEIMKDAEEIEISIRYKSQNLEKAWLMICRADKNGKALDGYLEEMPDTEKWSTVKVNISGNHPAHLFVHVLTKSDNLRDQVMVKNTGRSFDSLWMHFPIQKLWINKIEIKTAHFDMADFLPEMMPQPVIKEKSLVPLDLNDENTFSQIEELKNKKIVGIGESAHVTNEFPEIAYSLIKYRILHDNCKLVLLELPFSLGLKLNLFINKETSFGIKEIEDIFKPSSISSNATIDFLLWLKNYNKEAERKVHLVCIGIEQSKLNKEFLSFLNEYIQVDSLLFTPVYQDVVNRKNDEAWNKFLNNRERFEKILGKGETGLLMHGLKHPSPVLKAGVAKKFMLSERDSLMYDNVQIAVNNLLQNDETAVIYAHLAHATKSEVWMPRFISPVGKYLSDTYHDKYLSIALITYAEQMDSIPDSKGTDFRTFWNTTMAFSPAPQYSVEAACEKTKVPLFYTSTSALPPTVLLRYSGLDVFKGKFDYYPVKGVDAFIFISRVHKKSL
jgi:erythromycin esterase-like protein